MKGFVKEALSVSLKELRQFEEGDAHARSYNAAAMVALTIVLKCPGCNGSVGRSAMRNGPGCGYATSCNEPS